MSTTMQTVLNMVAASNINGGGVAARNMAHELRSELNTQTARVNELKRLDQKWNGGYQSAPTAAASEQLGVLRNQQEILKIALNNTIGGLNSFPEQKEWASETLRRLQAK
ncbi:MAG: hypothetical protein U1E65_01605 [Myxococcota bacterium]